MSTQGFGFEVLAQDADSSARLGRLRTPRAEFETPVFMPVGTQATVKSQSPEEVAASGARLMLANTYHLMLRPGADLARMIGSVTAIIGSAAPMPIQTVRCGVEGSAIARARST